MKDWRKAAQYAAKIIVIAEHSPTSCAQKMMNGKFIITRYWDGAKQKFREYLTERFTEGYEVEKILIYEQDYFTDTSLKALHSAVYSKSVYVELFVNNALRISQYPSMYRAWINTDPKTAVTPVFSKENARNKVGDSEVALKSIWEAAQQVQGYTSIIVQKFRSEDRSLYRLVSPTGLVPLRSR